MKKRIISLLLAVVMMVTCVPLEAFAADGSYGSQWVSSGSLSVIGDGGLSRTPAYGIRFGLQFLTVDDPALQSYTSIQTSKGSMSKHECLNYITQAYATKHFINSGGKYAYVVGSDDGSFHSSWTENLWNTQTHYVANGDSITMYEPVEFRRSGVTPDDHLYYTTNPCIRGSSVDATRDKISNAVANAVKAKAGYELEAADICKIVDSNVVTPLEFKECVYSYVAEQVKKGDASKFNTLFGGTSSVPQVLTSLGTKAADAYQSAYTCVTFCMLERMIEGSYSKMKNWMSSFNYECIQSLPVVCQEVVVEIYKGDDWFIMSMSQFYNMLIRLSEGAAQDLFYKNKSDVSSYGGTSSGDKNIATLNILYHAHDVAKQSYGHKCSDNAESFFRKGAVGFFTPNYMVGRDSSGRFSYYYSGATGIPNLYRLAYWAEYNGAGSYLGYAYNAVAGSPKVDTATYNVEVQATWLTNESKVKTHIKTVNNPQRLAEDVSQGKTGYCVRIPGISEDDGMIKAVESLGSGTRFDIKVNMYVTPSLCLSEAEAASTNHINTASTVMSSAIAQFGTKTPSPITGSANTSGTDTVVYQNLTPQQVKDFLLGKSAVYFWSEQYKDYLVAGKDTFYSGAYATVGIKPSSAKWNDVGAWNYSSVTSDKKTLTVNAPAKDGGYILLKDETQTIAEKDCTVSGKSYVYDWSSSTAKNYSKITSLQFSSASVLLDELNAAKEGGSATVSVKLGGVRVSVDAPSSRNPKLASFTTNYAASDHSFIADLSRAMATAATQGISGGSADTVVVNTTDIDSALALFKGTSSIDVVGCFSSGKQYTEDGFSYTITVNNADVSIRTGGKSDFTFSPGSPATVKKSYIVPPVTPDVILQGSTLKYSVDATPDSKELAAHEHTSSYCSVWRNNGVTGSYTCAGKANPKGDDPKTTVTLNITADEAGRAAWNQAVDSITKGGQVLIKYERALVTNGVVGSYGPLDFASTNYKPAYISTMGLNPLKSGSVTVNGKSYSYGKGTYYKNFSASESEKMKTALKKFIDVDFSKVLEDRSYNKILNAGEQCVVRYRVTVEIQPNSPAYSIKINGDPNYDDVSWFVNGSLKYWSVLEKNYAELKEGAILDEEFEAMAGTPTTRNLYFASGGNQWVVQATYNITTFNAQRQYTYKTEPVLCKFAWGVSHGSNMKSPGSHTGKGGNQYGCYQCGDDPCKNKHVASWTFTKEVHNKTPCTCENCKGDHVIGKDSEGKDIKGSKAGCQCAGKPHSHHCSPSPAYYTPATYQDCNPGGISLSGSYSWSSCGGEGCSGGSCSYSESCPGQESGTETGKYVDNNSDLTSARTVTWNWKHCACCCSGNEGYEHYSHEYRTSENWYSLMTDISAMSIVDLKVWKLTKSLIQGTADLFGQSQFIGEATNEPNIYTRRVKDLKTQTGATASNQTGLYGSGVNAEKVAAAGRVVYNWFPEQGDVVNLNTVSGQGGYAGSSNEWRGKTLYAPNTCSSYYRTAGEDSPYDLANDYIQKKYLDYVKNDTTGKGHRFGLTVISDYIVLTNNNSNIQSIYYNEYTIYAGGGGTSDTGAEDKGISLYAAANFSSVPTRRSVETSYIDGSKRYSNRLSKSKASGAYNSSYWKSRGPSLYSTNVAMKQAWSSIQNNPKYKDKSAVQLWLWDFNKWCTQGAAIKEDKVYYGGYTGNYADTTEKYDGTNYGYKSNMTESQLANTYLVKNWSKYSSKNQYCDMCYNDSGHAPRAVNGIYDLQVDEMTPLLTAENGLYSFEQSKVFYEFVDGCELDDPRGGRRAPKYKNTYISWAGGTGFEVNSGYWKNYRNDKRKWTVNDVVIYDPACTEVDVYVYWDTDCQKVIDDRVPGNYGSELVFNLEGDGWISFPLIGNLDQGQAFGIANASNRLGKGWYNNMDVSEWCAYKRLKCTNYIIIDTNGDGKFTGERIWRPGDLIFVQKEDAAGNPITKYRFYLPEMASEQNNTLLYFYDEAINDKAFGEISNTFNATNKYVTTSMESSRPLYRKHDCENYDTFDVVGRIGNLTMVDTGDFRYSNFFKKILDGSWLIPNVVYRVDSTQQQRVVIDEYDIFHRQYGTADNLWNTYGSQTHKGNLGRNNYYYLPLLPSYNNITAFTTEPVRLGYDTYMDVETIGNYYSSTSFVNIKYSYYAIDKNTGAYIPVDVYMKEGTSYRKINDFNNDTNVYDDRVYMNWLDDNQRRQYTAIEAARTELVANTLKESVLVDGEKVSRPASRPNSNSILQGNRNELMLKGDSSTYIGDMYFGGAVSGFNTRSYTNVGSYFDEAYFYRNAQKWYFTEGLPSSAVFVKHSKQCTEANINEINDIADNVMCTAYIVAKGDTWTLVHDSTAAWSRLRAETPSTPTSPNIPKPDFNPDPDPNIYPNPPTLPDPPTPIHTITPPIKTSRDDLNIQGTH